MRTRLRIKDFQCLENVDILLEGLTAIKGLNNQGKTAVIRAFKAACCGRMGDDFIRMGTKKTMVGIEFGASEDLPAAEVAWIKQAGKGAVYVLNGEEFKKLGKVGVPLDELRDIGIRQLEYASKKDFILVWDQREHPFLIKLTPTHSFDLVSRVMEERKVLPVVKEMKSDLKVLKDKALNIEGAIQAKREDLKTLQEREVLQKPIDDLDSAVASLQKQSQEASDLAIRLALVNTLVSKLSKLSDSASKVIDRHSLMVSNIHKVELGIKDFDSMTRFVTIIELKTAIKAITGDLSVLDKAVVLQRELDSFFELQRRVGNARSWITHSALLSEKAESVKSTLGSLEPLDRVTSEVEDYRQLQQGLTAVGNTQLAIARAGSIRESKLIPELDAAILEVDQTKELLGVCPLCGGDLKEREI